MMVRWYVLIFTTYCLATALTMLSGTMVAAETGTYGILKARISCMSVCNNKCMHSNDNTCT